MSKERSKAVTKKKPEWPITTKPKYNNEHNMAVLNKIYKKYN